MPNLVDFVEGVTHTHTHIDTQTSKQYVSAYHAATTNRQTRIKTLPRHNVMAEVGYINLQLLTYLQTMGHWQRTTV